jgi:hypothetical protein
MFTFPTDGCTEHFQKIQNRPKSKGQGLCLQGLVWDGSRIHKKVHVLPNEETKGMIMRKCSICSAYKRRKETSVTCSTCGGALCKTPCFGKCHMKKNYQTGTQKFSIIPVRYSNISFKKPL